MHERRRGRRTAPGRPPGPAPGGRPGAVALPASPLELLRRRGRLGVLAGVVGPGFVVAIAYVDPGNFATAVQGGAHHGYLLLWVVLAANLMAMPVQYLSAKTGVATGRNLPELCRDHLPAPLTWGLWAQAELVAMATDLAELVGGAVALGLLFDVPLVAGGLITGAVAIGLLGLQSRGYRGYERVIAGLFAVVLLGFLYQALRLGAPAGELARGFVPTLAGADSLLLAAAIVGATVMPHVIYLHSALTQDRIVPRDAAERRALLRLQRLDIGIAMGLAGVVNLLMLVIAASAFRSPGGDGAGVPAPDTLAGMHAVLGQRVGAGAAAAFALALLASGLAASSVGTYAGQVVMQGFLDRRIPLLARRLLTLAPGLAVLVAGVDPTTALVYSQVLLSFGIPFALVPLVALTRRRDVMGPHVNPRALTAGAGAIAALVIALNALVTGTLITGA